MHVYVHAAVAVEFAVRYEAMQELCPSPRYDTWLVELSACQVLDRESTYCDVTDITSLSTIRQQEEADSNAPARRRLASEAGFDIYLVMDLSAHDHEDLKSISDYVMLYDQFAHDVQERWRNNGEAQGVSIGRILSVVSEHDIPTLAPSAPPIQIVTVHSPTALPCTSALRVLLGDARTRKTEMDSRAFGAAFGGVLGSISFLEATVQLPAPR